MKTKSPFLKKKCYPLLLSLLFLLSPVISSAQPMYAIVEFMKTKPGQEWRYVELESNFWKQVHQARIENGEIVAWLFYHIRYTGSNDVYNYATVTIFNDPSKLENPWTVDPITVHPSKDVERILQETDNARDLVITSLLQRRNFLSPPENTPRPKFAQVDYMKVEQGGDESYLELEDKLWKPIHAQFLKDGTRSGWSLWGRVFPAGYGLDYQYITVNDFPSFNKIGTANYLEAFQQTHSNVKLEELSDQTNRSRYLVKSELWELLDAAF